MPNFSTHLEPLNVVNLREHIKREVCNAILSGLFKPGGRLNEAQIADQLGVSRAPVREALASLERDGIVTSIPRRGYFVVNFTDKDIEEIYSLRRLLEVGALQRALPRITSEHLAALQRIVDGMGEEAENGSDPARMIVLDTNFHGTICQLADNSRLYSAWAAMRLQTWLLIGLTSRTHSGTPDDPKEFHQRILDAIKANDLALAETRLSEHLDDAERRARIAWKELLALEPAPRANGRRYAAIPEAS
ncbi:MAG: GntR family transcriptional regulator [Anaerolineae bacterium]